MSLFDTYVMVDWSGGNDAGAKPKKDAIWACVARVDAIEEPVYLRNRQLAEAWLGDLITAELAGDRKLCLGFDFPFGYPAGFGAALTGADDPLVLWGWLEARVRDTPNANNRCELAGEMNARFDGVGPFWGNPFKRDIADLPRKGLARTNTQFPERRRVEEHAKGSFTCWQLSGAGAVGSQVLMGVPVLARLRRQFAKQVAIWPFEALDRRVAFVEIWPSLIATTVAEQMRSGEIKDAAQVRLCAQALAQLDATGQVQEMLDAGYAEQGEGWILGVGFEAALSAAARGVTHV